MKYLNYALWAIGIFFATVLLAASAVIAGPIVYIGAMVAVIVFFASLAMAAASGLRVVLERIFGGRSGTDSGDEQTSERSDAPIPGIGAEVYRDLKEGISDAGEFIQRQLSRVWTDVEEDLARLSLSIQRRSKKARRKWMKKRIEEMIEAHQNTFDLLSQKMNDHTLNALRVEYMECCHRINELEREIGDIRAAIAMKGEDKGGPYHRMLQKTEASLKKSEFERLEKIEFSRKRLGAYGVELNPQQAEVLLSRVDAGDIMQMTTVFSIISNMTRQFASAKLQSGENLDVTKKYYGMYIALLELQMFIQDDYLNRLNSDYLPGVQSIADDAQELFEETRKKANRSEDEHRTLYEKNIESQQFTLEVTRIYKDALTDDAEKVQKARELLRKHHDVAENTLKTVQVSADLSALMTQNESLYRDVMELQMPDLVPFENLQMQREFEAVTTRLREGS